MRRRSSRRWPEANPHGVEAALKKFRHAAPPSRLPVSPVAAARCDSRHHQSNFFHRSARRIDDAHDAALEHHGNSIGEIQKLFEFGGDQQDRFAFLPRAQQFPPYRFDGADIQAARGLLDDQGRRSAHDFAAQDELLQISAGKFSSGRVNVRRANAKARDELLRGFPGLANVAKQAACIFSLQAENGIVGDGHSVTEPTWRRSAGT